MCSISMLLDAVWQGLQDHGKADDGRKLASGLHIWLPACICSWSPKQPALCQKPAVKHAADLKS